MCSFPFARRYGSRVAIVDIDLHHGNGTEEIVREYLAQNSLGASGCGKLFFSSVHSSDLFPYTYPEVHFLKPVFDIRLQTLSFSFSKVKIGGSCRPLDDLCAKDRDSSARVDQRNSTTLIYLSLFL